MLGKRSLLGLAVVASSAGVIGLLPAPAYADYAPTSGDVVGVGSDTLQQLGDFIADGDFLADAGYNAGKKNKFISIDATADLNARLAYGADGATNVCAPGTGPTQGTGNQNSKHTEVVSGTSIPQPCTLNPTVILRAGQSPIQRPNGSGAGFNLLKADTNASGASINNLVDFSRASSSRTSGANFDSVTVGTDPLAMLTSSTSNVKTTLSIAELKSIYQCLTTDWSSIPGNAAGTIVPLLPQLGSGTRSSFLSNIGLSDTTIGSCVKNVEENDPEAIDASSSSVNAIEPMSQSRLFLYQGKLADGSPNGVGGYFKDPSCVGLSTVAPQCTTGATLTPNVKLWTTADSATAPDGGATYNPTRNLYIYFRHADQSSSKKFQPGDTRNWVQTMLNNPGGATPYFCSSAGQTLIAAAGITPACTFNLAGP